MNQVATLFAACLAGSALLAGAAEPQAKAPITRAALFKNGYALVVREIPAAPGDSFLIDETVTPVHGTLWFAPGDGLTISGVKRIGTEPNRNPYGDLSASYAGRQVTVTLRASGMAQPRIVTGTVVQPGKQEGEVAPNSSFFAVKENGGKLTVFSRDEIVSIESDAINETLPEEKRMLLVNRAGMAGKPFAVSYLSSGLTWAPATALRWVRMRSSSSTSRPHSSTSWKTSRRSSSTSSPASPTSNISGSPARWPPE